MTEVGLRGAPATKFLLCSLCVLSVILGSAPQWRHALVRLRFAPHIIPKLQLWRLATIQLSFNTTTELVRFLVLLYYMSTLERIFGSRKFSAFIFIHALVGQTLVSFMLAALRFCMPHQIFATFNMVSAGPYVVLYACVQEYCSRKALRQPIRLFGLQVDSKWVVYLVIANMMFSRLSSTAILAAAGLAANYLYNIDLAGLKQWRFPAWTENFATKWMYPLLDQPSPSRYGSARMASQSATLHAARRQQQPQNTISAELVENLQSMFPTTDQEQIIQALQTSNGNPEQAVAILLSSSRVAN
ncbi:hypothetical protein LPJ55_004237 [Coemansia sp. RSA 990]|nr:hypothetical protein LPJ55_004237 [Coemansia sp. RSA 990]KAJ2668455.1 hypothetical protein IWW42_005185 [Coemansia sp. RSA 1085]